MQHNILDKDEFTISDLAKIIKKQSQTIRSYERKGIIQKPNKKKSNGWRVYSREDLAQTIEKILEYNWERNVIKNKSELYYVVDYLRGKHDKDDFITLADVFDE